MEKSKKNAIVLSIVAVVTLITLVVGATYAYFKAQGGTGGSSDVNVITATTDLLTFKIDKAINIGISQSGFKKGNPDASDSTGAHATLTASNSKNVEKTTRSYNIYFVIDTNDFEYTTQDGTPELYLNVTDPNGNKLENITGLVHYDKGFDITTRTGGFLLVPDYDIEATRGNTITQDWKVEVTFANLDTDQSKNMGKSLSGKLFVTSDKMNSCELSKITNMTTKTTYNSIDTTLDVEQGSAEVNKYFYGIEKTSSNVTGYVNNSGVKKVALKDVNFVETDKNTYKFDNLSDNSIYKVYSYGVDKNGIKTNLYETEVTTNEYNNPVVNSISHTSTLNSITLSVNATKGDNDIVKYYYSKDNGQTYEESDTNSYVFNNLKDTTEYKIKVKVLDSYGRYSTEYAEAIATTTYILPSVTKVSPTTKYNQITVTTTGTKGTNEISKYYYSINNSSYVEGTSTYTFTNLNEQTTYNIKVKVADTNGRMSNEYSLSATTDAYKLPTITDVTTSSTLNSITINVSGQNGDGAITEYYYSKDDGSNYVKSTEPSYEFTDLTTNTTFYIKVYVKDSNGRISSVFTTTASTEQVTIADYVMAQYTGTQGENGVYSHDKSLVDGANDDSYRYAGPDEIVNNYICLGSSATSCPDDNLFRIVGSFYEKEYLVKVIKVKALGKGVEWNLNQDNEGTYWAEWNNSTLNSYLNNEYLQSIASLSDIIASPGWESYKSTLGTTPKSIYQNEYVNGTLIGGSSNKIGLISVSDYGYASSSKVWNTSVDDKAAQKENWLSNLYTWSISVSFSGTVGSYDYSVERAYVVGGGIIEMDIPIADTVRPAFYLASSVTYAGGSGTRTDPIRINL